MAWPGPVLLALGVAGKAVVVWPGSRSPALGLRPGRVAYCARQSRPRPRPPARCPPRSGPALRLGPVLAFESRASSPAARLAAPAPAAARPGPVLLALGVAGKAVVVWPGSRSPARGLWPGRVASCARHSRPRPQPPARRSTRSGPGPAAWPCPCAPGACPVRPQPGSRAPAPACGPARAGPACAGCPHSMKPASFRRRASCLEFLVTPCPLKSFVLPECVPSVQP